MMIKEQRPTFCFGLKETDCLRALCWLIRQRIIKKPKHEKGC